MSAEGDALMDVPLDNDSPGSARPQAVAGAAGTPHSEPVRGEAVMGEEPEEEEEEDPEDPEDVKSPGHAEVQPTASTELSGEPLSGAGPRPGKIARQPRNSEELKAERERLDRHFQQRRVLHAHNRGVREALLAQLLGRLATGKAVCETLLGYLKSQTGHDTSYATDCRQVGEQVDNKSRQQPEVGSLRKAVEALCVASSGTSTHFASIADFGRTESMRRVQQLIQDLEARIKATKEQAAKANKALNAQVDKANQLYKEYQQADAIAEAGSGPAVECDPYVVGIQYQAAMAELQEGERGYQEALGAMLEEVEQQDRQRIETLKSILSDFLQARVRALEGVLLGLRAAAAAAEAVSEDDFLAFRLTAQREVAAMKPDADLAPYNFDVAALDTEGLRAQAARLPPLLDAVTDALTPCDMSLDRDFSADVVREGWLKTKGRLLKPGKPVYVQLTRHGFLHCFASKGGCLPDTSIALVKCEVETEKEDLTFCVQVKRTGMQVIGKEKHHLQADTQEAMVEWICAIKDCARS